eukprot:TRINITY_DN3408_c0_g1_i10.p3 TRINITY_DN3408_c0_g1~~TRINITY_DN3408_c0_g1_i10.p3  ORF type:complete len:197 (-),score=69.97 TRINITY_DN3408_c0_g1_i10:82-672(-)
MARFYAPATLFFDEIDALFSKTEGTHEASRRVRGEMLVQMDGVADSSASRQTGNEKRVIVIAATNKPWDLDEGLVRRLEKRIYIPLPSERGRRQLFEINLRQMKVAENVDWKQLTKCTQGYSGADIANVCREASLMPFRKLLMKEKELEEIVRMEGQVDVPLTMEDFAEAVRNISKSVSGEFLVKYEKWMKEYGST